MKAARWLGLLVLAVIASLALMPSPWKGRLATFGAVHECAHVAAFLVASVLTTWRVKSASLAACTVLLILSFGVLLEFLQTRVYGNPLEIQDILANATGVAGGLLFHNLHEEWNSPPLHK